MKQYLEIDTTSGRTYSFPSVPGGPSAQQMKKEFLAALRICLWRDTPHPPIEVEVQGRTFVATHVTSVVVHPPTPAAAAE